MANSYYSRMYGMYKPIKGNKALKSTAEDKFKDDWKRVTERLKSCDYNLNNIYITVKN